MNTTPTSFSGDEDVNMVKKFYIVSCAALVACLCLFPQDAGATARQSDATALAPGASAGAPIRLAAQRVKKKRKSTARKAEKAKKKATKPTTAPSGQGAYILTDRIFLKFQLYEIIRRPPIYKTR